MLYANAACAPDVDDHGTHSDPWRIAVTRHPPSARSFGLPWWRPFLAACVIPCLLASSLRAAPDVALLSSGAPTLTIDDVTLAEDRCQNESFVFTVSLS